MKKLLTLAVLLCSTAAAQDEKKAPPPKEDRFAGVEVTSQDLGGGVHMLQGSGGNMGLFVGEDGAFLVDDQFAPLAPKIEAAVAKLTPKKVRFLVNTHWHGDHAGGNESFGKGGAVIVAHDNVRTRLKKGQLITALNKQIPATPKAGLPVITFADEVTFHWNGDAVRVVYLGPAHTDGDVLIRFEKANVVHTGDVFSNGVYPFMDVSSGGTLDGMIAAQKKILGLIDDETKIIPGHGPVGTKGQLKDCVTMLIAVRDRIAPMIAAGKSADEVVAAKPTAEFDAKYGGGWLKPDRWVRIAYSCALPKK